MIDNITTDTAVVRSPTSATFFFFAKFLSKAGVPTVLCNGEMGEFSSLTTEERTLLVQFAREAFSGENRGGH